MFNEIPLETLQSVHGRIQAELSAGVADDLARAQYERVEIVLQARIAELGGSALAAVQEQEDDEPTDQQHMPEPVVDQYVEAQQNKALQPDVQPSLLLDFTPKPPEVMTLDLAKSLLPSRPSEQPKPVEPAMQPLPDAGQPNKELSPIVESGLTIWTEQGRRTKKGRRIISTEELEVLRAKEAIRAATRQNEAVIIRFDPLVGTYDRHGKMYADPTESPTIAKNLQAIVEVCSHISHLSQDDIAKERGMHFSVQTILEELGLDGMDQLSRRMLFKEVMRIIGPSRAVSHENSVAHGSRVTIWRDFSFVMTELTPRAETKKPDNTPRADDLVPVEIVRLQDRTYSALDMRAVLLAKKIPKPTTHKQAVTLLDALMCESGDFLDELQRKAGAEHVQIIKDLAHTFAQQELGWESYLAARNMRTFRSGNPGFSGVVRQITGSQQRERFERSGHVSTHKKTPTAGQ